MNFFEHQDVARRKSSILVVYFCVAVILIIAAVYLTFILIFVGFKVKSGSAIPAQGLWHPDWFLWVTCGTLGLVIVGSLYKTLALRGGGDSIAASLGGRLVNSNTEDLDERKLLNIVEEMAIASGTPVPRVYLLDDEQAINAFAAGYAPGDAVIGVTRGCMRILTRDELQGVIAHEFSHIINGDMRLNIRLIAILHGILLIGIAGFVIFRSFLFAGHGYHNRRSSRRQGGSAMAIILLGLALIVIGYLGMFFGKLIKSAVSRQREYLADSSAVQFTRNPDGIAGALRKIGGFAKTSRIDHPRCEEASHMFFGNALKASFLNAMATHPPLIERIQRIDPSFTGTIPEVSAPTADDAREDVSGLAARPPAAVPSAHLAADPAADIDFTPDEVVAQIGAPGPEHLAYAEQLRAAIPPELTAVVHEPFGARAVFYCLLLNTDLETRDRQMQRLAEHADAAVFKETRHITAMIDATGPEMRLPLVDLSLPALKELSPQQYGSFRDNVHYLIEADDKISLFEYTMHSILIRNLDNYFEGRKPPRPKYHALRAVTRECQVLLSTLARVGSDQADEIDRAFAAGVRHLNISDTHFVLAPEAECGLGAIDKALEKLALVSFKLRKQVILACAACICSDRHVTIEEAELLRAVTDSLACPLAPFIPRRADETEIWTEH